VLVTGAGDKGILAAQRKPALRLPPSFLCCNKAWAKK